MTHDEAAAFNARVSQVVMENLRLSNLNAYYREKVTQQNGVIEALRAEIEYLSQFRPAPPAPAVTPTQESLAL